MFFSLLKWWMLKKRWFRSETRSKSSRPAPGKFGQHPTQGWSSELTGLLAEQRESGQVPNFNAGNANSSNNGTYTRGARLTLIQVPKVPSSIWVMSFSNIMKLCVYIYIYTSQYSSIFLLQDGILNAFLIPSIFCLFGDMRLQGLKVARKNM